MIIQRDDDIRLRVADEYGDPQFQSLDDESIQFDYDSGRLGHEEQDSTSSFNSWSNSSLEHSVLVGGTFGQSLNSIEELQRRIFDIVHSQHASTVTDLAEISQRPRRERRRTLSSDFSILNEDYAFGFDSLILNRERPSLTQNVRSRRLSRIEVGLQDDQEVASINRSVQDTLSVSLSSIMGRLELDSLKLLRQRLPSLESCRITDLQSIGDSQDET